MQKESTAYLVQSKWMIRKAATLSWLWLVVSTCSPDPTQTVPDQTQAHPRPSQSIYSISKPICSIPKLWAALTLLSKHFWSSEHHSRTHLTIPDELKTSWICHDRDLLQPSATHSQDLGIISEPTSQLPTPIPDHAWSLPTRSTSTQSLVPISR